jgi:hypothetical protein
LYNPKLKIRSHDPDTVAAQVNKANSAYDDEFNFECHHR